MSPSPLWLLAVLSAASATVLAAITRDMRRAPARALIRETEQHLRNAARNREQQ